MIDIKIKINLAKLVKNAKDFLTHPVKRIIAVFFGLSLLVSAATGELFKHKYAIKIGIIIIVILLAAEIVNIVIRRFRDNYS